MKMYRNNKRKNIKASNARLPKRAIKAFDYGEYDDDEIADAEYAEIEYSIDSANTLFAWIEAIQAGIDEYKQDWQPWGGDTSEWEMFSGPDDAEAFRDQMYDLTSEVEKLAKKIGDALNVYIYPNNM